MLNTNIYAKAGVMIRESLTAGSRHALLDSRPGTGIEFLVRSATSGSTVVAGSGTQAFPSWLRLARTGQSIVASVSADGSTWSVVGTETVTMASTVYVGLAVTSHDLALLNTAAFDNVAVASGALTQPPAAPSSPTPGTGATGVSISAVLTWSAVGATSYDINFGTTNPPPRVVSGHASNSYQPGNLTPGLQYYWQVVARNTAGASTGAVWSFTTAAAASTGVPAPWANQDVGAVGQPGRAAYSSGTFTVEGSGADIWHTADAFQFVHRPLSGNGEIVARVMSLTDTHYYAKAGVMLRADVGSSAAHVLLNLLPNGDVEFITRQSAGGTTTFVAGSQQSPPAWLKLVRSDTTITGFASRDGSAWTQVGSTDVTMSSDLQAGLAVTSHNTSMINKAVFDHVTVSAGGTAPPPTTSSGDVVIYASDIPSASRHGAWQTAGDSQSPNGVKLSTADSGLAFTNEPVAAPQHYVDVTFNANAGTPYRVWLRLRADGDSKWNDSLWVQFSDALVNGSPEYRMNSTAGLLVNMATDAWASSLNGWGWHNGAYWLSQPTVLTFPTSGAHTLRVQIREDGVQFDQIVLSPTRFMDQAPGSVSGDSVVVPRD
jgi:regulation of enolase protein 1 (concanavalin A-like superfamily)